MSILGIDIGTSTIKIIEYKENNILNKAIFKNKNNTNIENALREFMVKNETEKIEKIVLTGIGRNNFKKDNFSMPVETVDEFSAIAKGGLKLANLERAIVVSVGTGTCFIKATKYETKHLGGTGVGAGTLANLCAKFVNAKDYDTILELSKRGDLSKIDLRMEDITKEKIPTLPQELTLSNFGKLSLNAGREDIVLGILNMIFEVIGMMAAFCTLNTDIKDIVLIGNIVSIPAVHDILRKIEKTHNVRFHMPKDTEFGVAYGAIKYINE